MPSVASSEATGGEFYDKVIIPSLDDLIIYLIYVSIQFGTLVLMRSKGLSGYGCKR